MYEPGVDRLASEVSGVGLVTLGTDVAAAASSSSPFGVVRFGVMLGGWVGLTGKAANPSRLSLEWWLTWS